MLKNAKTEYFNEHEEIATYLAIETLAEKVGDRETAQLARRIRREEERMAKFLAGQIKALTGAVVSEEVPRAQRVSSNRTARKRSARASTSTRSNGAARSRRSRSTAKRGAASKRRATAGKR